VDVGPPRSRASLPAPPGRRRRRRRGSGGRLIAGGERPDRPGRTRPVVSRSTDTFPRQHARTRRFTLGRPRSFTVSSDGTRVAFLRSGGGADPLHSLWEHRTDDGTERLLADPSALAPDGDRELPPEERARRERVRESGGGIVAYAADEALTVATFALGGRLFVCDLAAAETRMLAVEGPVVDPRPDPTGRRVAYVRNAALHVADLATAETSVLAGEDGPDVTWGLAEFVAAEEMDRTRGFWWAPDGERLAVARADTAPVRRWHIADPVDPEQPPATVAYPAAGTANAEVTLAVVALDGARVAVEWDIVAFPYLAAVEWAEDGPLTVLVQSRSQRTAQLLAVDADSGETRVLREDRDRHWVELVGGVPRWLPDGRLVTTIDEQDTRRLAVDGVAVTPPGLQVRRVISAEAGAVVVLASEEPTAVSVWRVALPGGKAERLTPPVGVHDAAGGDAALVVTSRGMDRHGARTVVLGPGSPTAIRNLAETPVLTPRVELLRLGPRALRAALLLPHDWVASDGPLPVLLDPYGGPHAQRVLQARDAYLVPQWFADAGFAVLVVDGRGSPGRGPRWERAVAGDLASAPLEDQVGALKAAALRNPALDTTRVAIRGWSFGGYLAALAVLRRPDVFHAAIAGAPVTDMRLYDTHYTERYLGTPADHPAAYARSSLLGDAAMLERPLLLIHGLADDNVVAAHTLRLSRALLEAGRPHQVLPLSGVTHMTPQEEVAENLLLLQLGFLRTSLGLKGGAGSGPAPTA